MGRLPIVVVWTRRAADHFSKHGVTEQELREMFDHGVVFVPSTSRRMKALGMTQPARMLCVIVEERASGIWSAISARKMEPGEVQEFVRMGGLE